MNLNDAGRRLESWSRSFSDQNGEVNTVATSTYPYSNGPTSCGPMPNNQYRPLPPPNYFGTTPPNYNRTAPPSYNEKSSNYNGQFGQNNYRPNTPNPTGPAVGSPAVMPVSFSAANVVFAQTPRHTLGGRKKATPPNNGANRLSQKRSSTKKKLIIGSVGALCLVLGTTLLIVGIMSTKNKGHIPY
eukprot:GHVT01012678.1.p1 GENE.GHVT01012678.1~~GHVT01012678.1.p1  ORF type:complete len:186 (-),score=5.18 GHVT01012678.1:457-1014(-)